MKTEDVKKKLKTKGIEADRLTFLGKGYYSHTYLLKDAKKVVKVGSTDIKREVNAMKALKKIKMPVPTIYEVFEEEKFFLMEYIQGKTLKETLTSGNAKKHIKNIAEMRKKQMNIEMDSCADLKGDLTPQKEYEDGISYHEDKLSMYIENIQNHSLLKEKTISNVKEFWHGKRQVFLEEPGPALCQGDSNPANIIVKDDEIRGVVDFEHAHSSGILSDVFHVKDEAPLFRKNLDVIHDVFHENTYEEIKELFDLYQILIALGMLCRIPKVDRDTEKMKQLAKKKLKRII